MRETKDILSRRVVSAALLTQIGTKEISENKIE